MAEATAASERSNRRIDVPEGHSEISKNGDVLVSNDFNLCTVLILQKDGSKEAFLAHIDDTDMNNRQYNMIKDLSKGNYRGVFVRGALSKPASRMMRDTSGTGFLRLFSVGGRDLTLLPDIFVNSGNSLWSISYSPSERKIKTVVREGSKVSEHYF